MDVLFPATRAALAAAALALAALALAAAALAAAPAAPPTPVTLYPAAVSVLQIYPAAVVRRIAGGKPALAAELRQRPVAPPEAHMCQPGEATQ